MNTTPTVSDVLAATELSFDALLQQHTVWRSWAADGELTTHFLVDMEMSHRVHVRRCLRQMAPQRRDLHLDQLARDYKAHRITEDQFLERHAAVRRSTAEQWLDAQPLVIQLDNLTREAMPARGLLRRFRR
jgi:hypothetical protein